MCLGEVSDSSDGEIVDSDQEEQFYDGYDDDLIGDEDDRKRLEAMTEKEREQELFNRIERRQTLKTRYSHLNVHQSPWLFFCQSAGLSHPYLGLGPLELGK